jgi:hypothetical protein
VYPFLKGEPMNGKKYDYVLILEDRTQKKVKASSIQDAKNQLKDVEERRKIVAVLQEYVQKP